MGDEVLPQWIRLNRDAVYRVERVRDIQPADPTKEPYEEGWLEATLVAYSDERDETATIQVIVPPRADDPTKPDWERMRALGQNE